MNNIKLLTFLIFFCFALQDGISQSRDSTEANAPAPAQKDPDVQKPGSPQNADNSPPVKYPPNRHAPPRQKKNLFNDPDFWKKVYWGGNLALSLGNGSGYYEISPNAGYKFNDVFSVGPQIIYQSYTYAYGTSRYNFNIYGAGAFVRALIIPMIFLQAEYDVLSVPDSYSLLNTSRAISDEKLVGLGLKNSWGESFSYYITILYDINPTPRSPYYYLALPIITRAGFSVNF